MSPNEIVGAIVAELYRRVRNGRLGRLQRALNVGKNFFSHWKSHPASVRLLPLAEALEYLEIKPVDFFTSAFNQESSLAPEPTPVESCTSPRLKSLLKSLEAISEPGTFFATIFPTSTSLPSGWPPAGVIKALARLAALSSDLGDGRPTENQPGEMIDRQELTRLEDLRWNNPQKANLMLERAISSSPIELLTETLLLYGKTLRQLDRLGDARWAYFVGQLRAKATGDRHTLAEILQKWSWVEYSESGFLVSVDLLRHASGIFSELGEFNREAKVMVDMAIQYANCEMLVEAASCATSALQHLKKDEYQNQFSAHQVLAFSMNGLQRPKKTLAHLEKAKTLLVHCPKEAAVRFVWMEAKMSEDLLSLASAAAVFEEAAYFLIESGEFLDGSVAMLECFRCLVDLGDTRALERIATIAKSLAFTVSGSGPAGRVAEATMMEFYRASLAGSVPKTLITAARRILGKAAGVWAPAAPG
jgi:hypothetical protein